MALEAMANPKLILEKALRFLSAHQKSKTQRAALSDF
jgi:hypothetical protein